MKGISILGSTGSIGTNTLDVIRQHRDLFQVITLAAGRNLPLLYKQIEEFRPKRVAVATKELADELRIQLMHPPEILYGEEGLIACATHGEVEFVVAALVGFTGLAPTLAAIEAGKDIGLANKETLVAAGHLVMEAVKRNGVRLLPIDSEHSAIFQSLQGERREDILRILLTASGGAFREKRREELKNVTVEEALKHPNWKMGAKITLDSATMMNKGFEVIEAHWLFSLPYSSIDVVLHYESILHSMVEFVDGAIIGQLGTPDMRIPIQYALTYPVRIPLKGGRLNLAQIGQLTFREVDAERYPALSLAYEAGEQGGTYPTVLNAANEAAVQSVLARRLPFYRIEEVVAKVLERHSSISHPSLTDILEADRWAREEAQNMIG
ncbi:1-deoxy-D-xylulose-5-phosphate reductoisomerase [Thermicanus aegyptius]|uniref:1-deoxy-D-xylulose-5-phosphate reductoisomerase n=1 Tax=Thermicanus aegyptius TaxID=94009 RepID=UPI00048F1B04|nr:1-deoxy-D-xylulose-5-phosphate reductoisomerase [Thermicanus aegyptius]